MSGSAVPRRGEIWDVDLGFPIGPEAAFLRPAVVVSSTRFNRHALVVVCPITSTGKGYPTRVPVLPGSSGLDMESQVQVEQVRTVSAERLARRRGRLEPVDLHGVEQILRLLLEL